MGPVPSALMDLLMASIHTIATEACPMVPPARGMRTHACLSGSHGAGRAEASAERRSVIG